ncbi:MAG TPA: TrbI/VirB10 family protein [Terriglobales bacterium]|nr:TrbI/VirB10 family protein [Terriglobales bacterium]
MSEEKDKKSGRVPPAEEMVDIPELHDRRPKPEGVLPKQSQAYAIVGLAVLILMAVMFSKNQTKPATKPSAAGPAVSTEANRRNIEELQRELTEQQRKSEETQSRSSDIPVTNVATRSDAQANVARNSDIRQSEPPHDPMADAERTLSFKARFASNLVGMSDAVKQSSSTQSRDVVSDVGNESLAMSPSAKAQLVGTNTTEKTQSSNQKTSEVNVNSAYGQLYVLFEGTTIDTALVNRLDGEFSGPVKVMVTNPVYSQDRQHILIPEGTFLLGEVLKVSGFGQKRLTVTFHRMLMPDGYSVDLDQFLGLDQVGETGLKDKVNNHYPQIFGASIALGIISGAAEATTDGGYNQSGSDMYRQGVASSLSQESAHVLDRFINIPPTLTIREGHRIKVYLTQDLLLPAYENHTVPPNI